jgi:hypothetical protein
MNLNQILEGNQGTHRFEIANSLSRLDLSYKCNQELLVQIESILENSK